jgi:hypothetical protein
VDYSIAVAQNRKGKHFEVVAGNTEGGHLNDIADDGNSEGTSAVSVSPLIWVATSCFIVADM